VNYQTWPPLLVVDVEGNGGTPPALVEVAAIPVAAGQPVPESAVAHLIRPPVPITPFATRVHHISNADVQDAPGWDTVGPLFQSTLGIAWIAAHNASVDYHALRRHLPDWGPSGVIDTLRLARHTFPDAPKHNLDALLAYTGIDLTDIPGARHRAGYDAHATALLLAVLAEHYPTWEALVAVGVPPGKPGLPTPPTDEGQTLW
jgi:DNA polymerase III epsilon subunit-like protein